MIEVRERELTHDFQTKVGYCNFFDELSFVGLWRVRFFVGHLQFTNLG